MPYSNRETMIIGHQLHERILFAHQSVSHEHPCVRCDLDVLQTSVWDLDVFARLVVDHELKDQILGVRWNRLLADGLHQFGHTAGHRSRQCGRCNKEGMPGSRLTA